MIKLFIEGFINLFFPEVCLGCKQIIIYGEQELCTNCLATLPQASHEVAGGEVEGVIRKLYGKVPVEWGTALFKFSKKSSVQALLHAIKYKNKGGLAVKIGLYYGDLLKKNIVDRGYDVIVPVPLHSRKLKERGYNQSALFAKGLAGSLGLPYYEDVLVRSVYTNTQTKKGRSDRWNNVRSAFMMGEGFDVKDKRILLVDDLITTGSTLTACSKILLEEGAQEIGIAVLAVAE